MTMVDLRRLVTGGVGTHLELNVAAAPWTRSAGCSG
jgi:hypothetical protein